VVLGRDLYEPEIHVSDRVVRAMVAEAEPRRVGSGGSGDDLVAKTYPEQRPPVVDNRPSERDRAREPGGVAGSGRQHEAVDVVGQRRGHRHRVRQDPDAGAPPAHPPDDVRLQAEVDDAHERATFGRVTDVGHCRRRDLADEVLVLPARHATGPSDGVVVVDEAGLSDDPAQRPVGPEVARQRPRIDARDRRDAACPEK
jgi:hypothetical protein